MSTVLIVEDSRTQRQMLSDLLQAYMFQVTSAKDGVEALEQMQTRSPDLVILDIVMPHLNGFEVCRRLKSNPVTKHIPIIFCSANATEVDCYWGLKQGAVAYLCKPFQPQELIDTVNRVLNSQGVTL